MTLVSVQRLNRFSVPLIPKPQGGRSVGQIIDRDKDLAVMVVDGGNNGAGQVPDAHTNLQSMKYKL